jgi:hypothetical protein
MIEQSTARLLGRTTAGTGVCEQLTVGSGLSLAAGSITAVAATDAISGVVELATTTETRTGVDVTRAITPAGFNASALGSIGSVLTNVTGSRAFYTNYTNSSGKPMFVYARAQPTANPSRVDLLVNGVLVATENVDTVNATSYVLTVSGIVPPSSYYSIEAPLSNLSLNAVLELT